MPYLSVGASLQIVAEELRSPQLLAIRTGIRCHCHLKLHFRNALPDFVLGIGPFVAMKRPKLESETLLFNTQRYFSTSEAKKNVISAFRDEMLPLPTNSVTVSGVTHCLYRHEKRLCASS